MSLPDSLKRFRKDFNLTQKAVANSLGIQENAYQRYEHGKVIPSVLVMSKLADAYNVSIDYLVGRTDVPEMARGA